MTKPCDCQFCNEMFDRLIGILEEQTEIIANNTKMIDFIVGYLQATTSNQPAPEST